MDQVDQFVGTPWRTIPHDDWNRPSYWEVYYQKLLNTVETRRLKLVTHREVDLLLEVLTATKSLPTIPGQTLLDAGCGIALIPHILAYWGFQVTAIDSCASAIEVAAQQQPTEEELAQCIRIWEPCSDFPGMREMVADPIRALKELRRFQMPHGSVRYLLCDWFSDCLPPNSYGVIHCRNSLRGSTKPYWRRSLQRFHELLQPGGLLLLEHVNAIGIRTEVEALLTECGFTPWKRAEPRNPANRHVLATWPTG